MNIIQVTTDCTVSHPGLADRSFTVGETVDGWSAFYWALYWSGNAIDTGVETPPGDSSEGFVPDLVVVSETDPHLGEEGIWFQPIGDDMTIWYEDGKNL